MKRNRALAGYVCALVVVLCLASALEIQGQSKMDSIVVEKEQHYETYQVGGTCIFATQNIALADLDGDGETEIATGGFTYDVTENGSRVFPSAPLKIWSWNGESLTLEASYKWPESTESSANIYCVAAADINQDGVNDLLTSGVLFNATGQYAQIRIWQWNGTQLSIQTSYEFEGMSGLDSIAPGQSSISSATVNDADKNGTFEIFTAGRTFHPETNTSSAQIIVWQWLTNGLIPLSSVEWGNGDAAGASSMCAADLDNDGKTEIVTGGFNHKLTNSSGQVCVWRWTGFAFESLAETEWKTLEDTYALNIAGGVQGNTYVSNVKAADVDKDGTIEIVTGGFTYDGENVPAQLRIWNWTGQDIALEKSVTWLGDYLTEVKSISINDVDADGDTEIVTSGMVAGQNSFSANATSTERAQLKVWSWSSADFVAEESANWTIGEGVCAWNTASGDIDKDGTVEIVTVGCMYIETLCDPDLRIWHVAQAVASASPETSPADSLMPAAPGDWQSGLIITVGVSFAIVILAAGYLFLRDRSRRR